MAIYKVKNQWGGSKKPWNDGGVWVMGCRNDQNLVNVNISSEDEGKTLTGEIVYEGEGPIGFKAAHIGGNNYSVENQWGGSDAPWNPGGNWIIGSRNGQRVIELVISSMAGNVFTGNMTYEGEGSIGFEASKSIGTSYTVENQWGGDAAAWNLAGTFILGTRLNQRAVEFELGSNDKGKTLTGNMTYAGEGLISFMGELKDGNNYAVENQWGGDEAPWHEGGEMIIGGRDNQGVISLKITSSDEGETFTGTMTYEGEGPIGFKAKLSTC